MKNLLLASALVMGAIGAQAGVLTSADNSIFLNGQGNYATGLTIEWTITEETNAEVEAATGLTDLQRTAYNKYEYTFSHTGTPEFSHIIVGLTPGCANDVECFFGFDTSFSGVNLEFGTFGSQGNSNPNLLVDLYGVKFDNLNLGDANTFSFSFYSNRQVDPNGRTYGKGGSFQGNGRNAGSFETLAGIVPTPDTQLTGGPGGDDPDPVVPEPMTMGLFGSGLAAIALARKFRK